MNEFKPGDVAMVTVHKKSEVSVDGKTEHIAMRDRVGSWASGTTFGRLIEDDDVKAVRPLAVIDFEDREAVERLAVVFAQEDGRHSDPTGDMQAALREFASPTPPKPEEPTDPAVRVLDCEGDFWARIGDKWVNGVGGKPQEWAYVVEHYSPLDVQS